MSDEMYEDAINMAQAPQKTTILLADDHPLFRRALRNMLEEQADFEIVAEASNGEEAVSLAIELTPNVVIMDISMPVLNGLEATEKIKARNSDIIILVLTVHEDFEHIIGILESGAAGYLSKSADEEEIVNAIRSVVAGETVLSTKIFRHLLKQMIKYPIKPVPLDTPDVLSKREVEIFKLVAKGLSNKDIGLVLNLSISTIKGHMVGIFSKLGVASRTEAVITGLRSRILTLDDLG
jgi:DNA-binding NarL/FixJ family response regulator